MCGLIHNNSPLRVKALLRRAGLIQEIIVSVLGTEQSMNYRHKQKQSVIGAMELTQERYPNLDMINIK